MSVDPSIKKKNREDDLKEIVKKLKMENNRADCQHPSLPCYDMALKESNESYKANQYPVRLERHHIIPLQELIKFWNKVLEKKLTCYLAELFKAMKKISPNVYPVGAKDLNKLLGLLCEPYLQKNPIDQATEKNELNDLCQLFQWLPGNLFIGPRHYDEKHKEYVRTDDPGNKFEENAKYILIYQKVRIFNSLKKCYDEIKTFNTNPKRQTKQNVQAIALYLADAATRAPEPLNARHWTFNEQSKTYTINCK